MMWMIWSKTENAKLIRALKTVIELDHSHTSTQCVGLTAQTAPSTITATTQCYVQKPAPIQSCKQGSHVSLQWIQSCAEVRSSSVTQMLGEGGGLRGGLWLFFSIYKYWPCANHDYKNYQWNQTKLIIPNQTSQPAPECSSVRQMLGERGGWGGGFQLVFFPDISIGLVQLMITINNSQAKPKQNDDTKPNFKFRSAVV